MPRINIELEGIRQNIQHMFSKNQGDLMEVISKTLEETLTEEWVKHRIKVEVAACVENAIKDIANNYELKNAITKTIVANLTPLFEDGTNGK